MDAVTAITAEEDVFPDKIPTKTKNIYYMVIPAPEYKNKGFTYTDQTGRFPFKSSRGNEYIMVLYDYDANCLLFEAIPNREGQTLLNAWRKLYHRLINNGHDISTYVFDNECSTNLKAALKDEKLVFKLVPPGQHRRNPVERGIRTFSGSKRAPRRGAALALQGNFFRYLHTYQYHGIFSTWSLRGLQKYFFVTYIC